MTLTLSRLVRLVTVLLFLIALQGPWIVGGKLRMIKPGCRYEGRRYQEGMSVMTSEPCLQCRCTEGALRCKLRICPRLPSPVPFGCRVRPPLDDDTCCADVVCAEPHEMENMLRRANDEEGLEVLDVDGEEAINAGDVNDDDDDDDDDDDTDDIHGDVLADDVHAGGCLHEGVRYGPGSAMTSWRRCKYCYCISGARRCIRPKCLLPLPGCVPFYAPHSCCPVSYNCTQLHSSMTRPPLRNGCRVDGRIYEEGEMVRDVKLKGPCDNCFCAMGSIRCVPLACAPPLQGCSPIVRHGHCCPSTYNCSGSIEVKATQRNYASYAFISKDYAKLRKETSFPAGIEDSTRPAVEGRGHRVANERIDASTIDAIEGFSTDANVDVDVDVDVGSDVESTSTLSPFDAAIMDNEILAEADAATFIPDQETTAETVESSEFQWSTVSEDPSTETTEEITTDFTKIFTDSTADDSKTFAAETTTLLLGQLCRDNSKICRREEMNGEDVKADLFDKSKIPWNTAANISTSKEVDEALEFSTEGGVSFGGEDESEMKGLVGGPSSTIVVPDDTLVMNVTVKTNVSVAHVPGVTINPIRSIPSDVEAIADIGHRQKDDDYDYDYSQPTLPPSLPNVRIIPFVAADALVKDKDAMVIAATKYPAYPTGSMIVPPELRPTESPVFYDVVSQENRFSPPVETEGGFVPREPPYFNAPYHSTDLNLEIGSSVTTLQGPIIQPQRKDDGRCIFLRFDGKLIHLCSNEPRETQSIGSANKFVRFAINLPGSCLMENREYRHGDILPNTSDICAICICYYGQVVCTPEKCAPLKIGCRRISAQDKCCGKIVCVDAEESPTVVLDRVDATLSSESQSIVPSDPFRDVIKTEPAPDLPSLIEDMFPHLPEHAITITASTTTLRNEIPPSTGEKPSMSMRFPSPEGNSTNDMTVSTETTSHEETVLKKPLTFSLDANVANATLNHAINEKIGERETTEKYRPSILNVDVDETGLTKIEKPSTHNSLEILTEDRAENVDSSESLSNIVSTSSSSVNLNPGIESEDSLFSFESVLDLLFSGNEDKTRMADELSTTIASNAITESSSLKDFTTRVEVSSKRVETSESSSTMTYEDSSTSSVGGLLKLAGCNIYGRMYRVGRIITELSGPCLECRCTEIGVQCKQLRC